MCLAFLLYFVLSRDSLDLAVHCSIFKQSNPISSQHPQETKGHRKVLASVDVNMKKYASATPAQFDLVLTLKPLSVKVLDAKLKLTLSCIFLKEGKAT